MDHKRRKETGLRKRYTDIGYLKLKLWLMVIGILIYLVVEFLF